MKLKTVKYLPRIPLEGRIDLTYRCNNNCRHCWLNIPRGSLEKKRELTLDEIKTIVDYARMMGCQKWSISGGEPMLRPDFVEIFDYITSKTVSYSLNTNGTLITPEIAQLLKRKGSKMIALYGANAKVHDHITRHPGSFDAVMQGFTYLKEAGAGFTVQLIPMRDNYHQFNEMINLAKSLSPHYRIGAAWLYLSACGDPVRNMEITEQRLAPADVITVDTPDPSYEEDWLEKEEAHRYSLVKGDDRLFTACIARRCNFHIDPYGKMTFCSFIKDPALRCDLRQVSFKECWEDFIPSLADKIKGGDEYLENCGSCDLRSDCRWCPVYGYLEHRRFSAKVEYLCSVAREQRRFKEDWQNNHRRYYQIGGITIQLDSDLPITETTFHPKFKLFRVDRPGEDTITIKHHFSLPDLNRVNLGQEVYRKPPWAIYKKGNSWIYLSITLDGEVTDIHQVTVFNHDYTKARIYNKQENIFRKGDLNSLTLFPSDQILLAQLLAQREGCYLHSSGVVLNDKGLLFVGHSGDGKTTIATMLKNKAKVLCDDRIIIRKIGKSFRIYSTWSHTDLPDMSHSSAPLSGILFLEQAQENRIRIIDNRKEIIKKLLACLIRPFESVDWWNRMLSLVETISLKVPCYSLQFDKSGRVVDLLKKI